MTKPRLKRHSRLIPALLTKYLPGRNGLPELLVQDLVERSCLVFVNSREQRTENTGTDLRLV